VPPRMADRESPNRGAPHARSADPLRQSGRHPLSARRPRALCGARRDRPGRVAGPRARPGRPRGPEGWTTPW